MMKTDLEQAGSRQLASVWVAVFDLLACIAGFALGLWLYGHSVNRYFGPSQAERIREVMFSALIAWSALTSTSNAWGAGLRIWIDRMFAAAGFNILIQYGLSYVVHLRPTPWPATIGSVLITVGLIAGSRKVAFRHAPDSRVATLLLGYDSVVESIMPALGEHVVGILGEHPERIDSRRFSPSAMPVLGECSRFEEVVAASNPGRIVVNTPAGCEGIAPRRLLALRYAGLVLEEAPTVFENALKRVCWERRDPLHLLLSPDLRINRPAVALQAVYTNVIGLALLVLLSPVLVIIAVVVALTTAMTPLVSYECPGFHRIPFRPLRFRTRRRDGTMTWSGRLLKKFRLVNLPQLINVVRGEMALFGPPPVRKEFAYRFAELIPVYAHRFIVKPGMMGWSQVNLPGPPDESLRLEYDLYYIREESPSLDLDILFRTIFRFPFQPGDAIQ